MEGFESGQCCCRVELRVIGSVGYGCLRLKFVISGCNQVDLVEGFGFGLLDK